ncbi:10679_t:CDS:2, partial [Entrophospora sp. SA101]
MVMLCMRSADVKNLRINRYKPSRRNDSRRQYLRQLACRHKIGHASSVEHYGVMNDRPNTPAPKQENNE